uniref:Uncharacterized protein n=1 Tax=Quercus lobata TaxID=97700 RepID=A0A7N2MVB4_QUELO
MDMETVPSSASVDLHTIRRRIRELAELHDDDVPDLTTTTSDSDEKLLRDFTFDFDNKVNQIVLDSTSHVASLTLQDFDAYFERLKEELNMVDAESTKISNEIEILARTNMEDSTQLETCLERLDCDLDSITSQGLEKVKGGANANCPTYGDDESSLINEPIDHKLELLELEVEIERNKTALKSLQDLDHMYRWFDAIEQIEDLLTGLKVTAFTENCIRLSLQTHIPKLEGSRKIEGIEPSVLNHELLIEVLEGTMELKSVESYQNLERTGVGGVHSQSKVPVVVVHGILGWVGRALESGFYCMYDSSIDKNASVVCLLVRKSEEGQSWDVKFYRFSGETVEHLCCIVMWPINCGALSSDLLGSKCNRRMFEDEESLGDELLATFIGSLFDWSRIFPNDVYVIDILDAAKSLSKSSLQWFITKIQDRITLCTLRHLVVKSANKSRFSLEYLDRDETIIAHMAGAVDAFIKISQDWPILSSPLKLISLKSSDHSKEISLTFLCKAEEAANSLDIHIRQDISSFVDAIEKILVEQMHLELHFDDSSKK